MVESSCNITHLMGLLTLISLFVYLIVIRNNPFRPEFHQHKFDLLSRYYYTKLLQNELE